MTRSRTLLASALLTACTGGVLSLAPAAVAADGGRPLSATLSGAAEVPSGDPDGTGTAHLRVNVGQRTVCYELAVSNIDPAVSAHIHEAPAGSTGPIVVSLTAPTGGTSSDCVTVPRELAKDILRSPEDYYVNVHNADFPGGAVRGQLG